MRTPTLILSDALADNGVPVKFVVDPAGGHLPSDPVHQADLWRSYVEWFST